MKYMILGNGYIGSSFARILPSYVCSRKDVDYTNKNTLQQAIDWYQPAAVINCAGFTGRPNIDQCEVKKSETVKANVALPSMISDVCSELDVRLVHISTGCLFQGDMNYTEEDKPASRLSFYSQTKLIAEHAVKGIVARIRLPFDGSGHPRCLLAKLEKYPKLINEPNSITYVPDLVWAVDSMIKQEAPDGLYHVTNSGHVTHKQIADLMGWKKEYIETWKLGPTKTNCTLSNAKLSDYYRMPHVMERLDGVVMARALAA